MNISILIPVSSDLRILDCLRSIDEKVEVVISLNKPTAEILALVNRIKNGYFKELSNLEVVSCQIDYLSIAGAYNKGIETAKFDNILLMDSDCIFEKETIRKLFDGYKGNLLSKGIVIFTYKSWMGKIIAKAREFHCSDKVSAYSPPLLFNKKIVEKIGGYYFHPTLCWLEDSEFDSRVSKANLTISYDPTAVVYHPELSVRTDLRSAFWYGVGKNIGVKNGIHQKPTGIIGSVKKYIFEASKTKGITTGIYLFLWKMTLLCGYLVQNMHEIRPSKLAINKNFKNHV